MNVTDLERFVGRYVFVTLDGHLALCHLRFDAERETYYLEWPPLPEGESGYLPFMDLTPEQIARFKSRDGNALFTEIALWSELHGAA